MKKNVFFLLFLCVATNSVFAQQLSVKPVDVRIEPDQNECTMIEGGGDGISDWVEQFRTAYNKKDIKFMDAIFSEDALFITGKVIQQRSKEGLKMPGKIKYCKQTKNEYLTKLRRVFAKHKRIRASFDEIEVEQHPTVDGVYGVKLHQVCSLDSCYHDDGYSIFLWDFRKKDKPTILVATWQPEQYFDGNKVIKISREEIFELGDFLDELDRLISKRSRI